MKIVVDELAPLKGYDGIPGITKVEEEPAAAAAATNAKRRPIVAGAVSICIAATLVFFGCSFMQRSSIPAAAFEAMTGSSPPTFPPDVQCGIDICNNSGHNRAYLFTGDECQDLNPPQNDSYLTQCYREYNNDCVYIWMDLDDPHKYNTIARSALVQCIGGTLTNNIPIGGRCTGDAQCVIPHGVNHGVCYNGVCNDYNTNPYAIPIGDKCDHHNKSPDQCQYPPGLSRGVCVSNICRDGESGGFCNEDVDCLSGDCLGTTKKLCGVDRTN